MTTKPARWRRSIATNLLWVALFLVALSAFLVVNVLDVLHQVQTSEDNSVKLARFEIRLAAQRLIDDAIHFNPILPTAPQQVVELRKSEQEVDHWVLTLRRGSAIRLPGITANKEDAQYLAVRQRWQGVRRELEQLSGSTTAAQAQALGTSIAGDVREMLSPLSGGSNQLSDTFNDGSVLLQAILAVLVMLVAFVILAMARSIWGRTRTLTDTVSRVANGEMGLCVEVAGDDELAQIAGSFNDLTARIRATLDKEGRFFTLAAHLLCIVGFDGRFKRLSRAWQDVLHQSDQALLEAPLTSIVHPDDRLLTTTAVQQIITTGTEITRLENRCLMSDGGIVWLSWNLKPVPSEQLIYCIAMEVTDRERLLDSIQRSALRLAGATASVLTSSTQHARGAQEQASAIAETVAAVEEVEQTTRQSAARAAAVAESSQLAFENGKAGRKAVEDSIAAMDRVREQVEGLADNIIRLAEQAQNIGEIVSSVDHIADQTNLLALNAAIEAARAGEQGKGFTVVANEIRLLADQSKRATVQVRQMLSGIQKLTQRSVLSMEEGTRSVQGATTVVMRADDTIRELVDTITLAATSASQILTSANQQSVGMKQIHQAMKNIQGITQSTLSATQQAQSAVIELNSLSETLQSMLGTNGHSSGAK